MRITLIGSGNVATHLGAAFRNAGHQLVQVYSRNAQHAALLAYHIKAEPISSLNAISPETDLFVIAVKDDAIAEIAEQLAVYDKLIVHTSGATSLSVLELFTDKAGVFYPLQTFSKNKSIDFNTVPICIEGTDEQSTKQLIELAWTVSQNVYRVDSEKRKILHLAAVFACNFPNYLYQAAGAILAENQLDFNLLRPLIAETAAKVQEQLPEQVQTGPAIRNDINTMQAHLQLLEQHPDLKQVYSLLSQLIIKMNNSTDAGA